MKRRFHSCPSPNKNENTNSARYELVSDSTTHAHYPFSISTSSSSISSFDDCEDRSVSHHEDTMERLIFEGLELVLDGAQAIENTIECHLSEYMKKREMTSAQEQANAITILPNVVYCLYFLLSGSWLSDDRIEASGNMEEIQWLDLGGNVPAKSSFFFKKVLGKFLVSASLRYTTFTTDCDRVWNLYSCSFFYDLSLGICEKTSTWFQ